MTTINLITKEDFEIFKKEFFAELEGIKIGQASERAEQNWIRSSDVRKLLKISPGTLHNLRINGMITYSKVGNMFYHKQEDIIKILETNHSKK